MYVHPHAAKNVIFTRRALSDSYFHSKVHDEAEDRRKEREAEAKSGGIDGLVMIPPSVHTKTQWLVTTVWRAEYLPVMDTGPILTHGGDFFTMVRAGLSRATQQSS